MPLSTAGYSNPDAGIFAVVIDLITPLCRNAAAQQLPGRFLTRSDSGSPVQAGGQGTGAMYHSLR